MKQLAWTVVAATDYVTTEEGEVVPAEISVVKADLEHGVHCLQYHTIIIREYCTGQSLEHSL